MTVSVRPVRAPSRIWFALLLAAALALLAACAMPGAAPAAETAPPADAATEPAAEGAEESAEEGDAAATPEPAAESAAEPAAEPAGADTRPAGEREPSARVDMYSAPPEMTIDPSKYYYATIETSQGEIRVQLFADRAPVTVNNFVYLAREGFYDNTTFHRVLEGFMAQAGDPTGTGTGGPGYTIPDEFVSNLNFDRPYLLAMANTGVPGSGGSQWFITFGPTEWLNQLHTIFGEVVEGQEVVDSITLRDPNAGATEPGDAIITITIEESDASVLPTPEPTPTPFPPSALDAADRPLAELSGDEKANFFSAAPELTIDPARQYTATITTVTGTMTVALFAEAAPQAVNNFVTLAQLGFYDGTPVNLANPELIVIGSPDNSLQNDVGYRFVPEVGLPEVPGAGSLAFAPQVQTEEGIASSGSILMIARTDPPAESAAQYGFFGRIVEGLDVLDALQMGDLIESITVEVSE